MKPLFYLLSLKISGIKNIEVPIELNFYKKTINNSDFDPEKYRIKAIYGENGSGKTAIITAVKILQNFLTDKNYLIFHSGNDPQIHDMLENLYIEYLGHAKYSYTFLNSMLIMFWAMLLRYHENDIESILTKDSTGNSVTEILGYLNRHYQSVSLSEAAEHFGYSSSHFSTLIKESTGRTFLQIIRDIKLNQACRALRETSLSNHAICELVGYESPEHFMRTFKKTYGMTPGEYRKKNKE